MTSQFAPQGERFVVELDGSTIADGSGKRIYCIDLRKGDGVQVDGIVSSDGTIDEGSLIVSGNHRMRQAMTIDPRVTGTVPAVGVPPPSMPETSLPPGD
jgi:hypothetical protein